MGEWQPIETLPDDLPLVDGYQRIEGSMDGKTFFNYYAKARGDWYENEGWTPSKPNYWRHYSSPNTSPTP